MDGSAVLVIAVACALAGAGLASLYALVRHLRAVDVVGLRGEIQRLNERVGLDASALGRRLEGIDGRMTETNTSNSLLAQNIFATLGDLRSATNAVAEQARQFSSLQDLLRAPKARGGLGEALLEELLRQVLPPTGYDLQHQFSSGVMVDAVVRAGGRLACIDSKFPLANYRRICEASSGDDRARAERAFAADVDKHINDIASRYILPDEGTFDFAVMYVPAEGVYAELLRLAHRGRPLLEAAMEAHVVPMSPLTMYGYLTTVLYGLKCLKIEANARAILGYCGRLQGDVDRFAADYDTLGKHLTNARSRYEDGTRGLDRLRDKLERVTDFELESPDRAPSAPVWSEAAAPPPGEPEEPGPGAPCGPAPRRAAPAPSQAGARLR